MQTISALPHALPPLNTLPKKISRIASQPAKNRPEANRRLDELMSSVSVSRGQLCVLAGAAGDIMENADGSFWLKPHTIDEGNFSKMLNGYRSISTWRMGQLCAICEFLIVIRKWEIDHQHPNAADLLRLLQSAPHHLQWFYKHKDIGPWLRGFRNAIYLRTKADRHLSPADAEIYRYHVEFLRSLGFVDKDMIQEQGQKAGQANELQAS